VKLSGRRKHQEEIDNVISEWTRSQTRAEIMEQLAAQDLFGGIVKSLDEVMTDPHLHERGTLHELEHPDLGPMTIFTSAIRLNGEPNTPRSPARPLGADTDAVLAEELGMRAEEIASLRARRII